MKIVKMKIDELTPAVYNPRKDLTPDDAEYIKLKRSIENFGYVDPIIFNEQTGVIVGGHQRLKVLKDMGYTELDVNVIDISENKEKALNVALNKVSGEFDNELLADLLNDLANTDIDVTLTGFDVDELNELMDEIDGEEEEETFTDVGDELSATNEVIIECDDEEMQREVYDKLTEEGYTCRVLTL